MPKLEDNLVLSTCPHCSVSSPVLTKERSIGTTNQSNTNKRLWFIYTCAACGGVVTAAASQIGHDVLEYHPASSKINEDIPEKSKAYLEQAMASIHAPAVAVTLAVSAVDSMLRERGYVKDSLRSRIEQACKDHLITKEMLQWSHTVKLETIDKNERIIREALPRPDDVKRVIDFSLVMAEFMFVLPTRVKRGLLSSSSFN